MEGHISAPILGTPAWYAQREIELLERLARQPQAVVQLWLRKLRIQSIANAQRHAGKQAVGSQAAAPQVAGGEARPQLVVGFAAETHDVQDYARKKLVSKSLDFIFANDVSDQSIGFNSEQNAGVLIGKDADIAMPMSSKRILAESIVRELSKVLR